MAAHQAPTAGRTGVEAVATLHDTAHAGIIALLAHLDRRLAAAVEAVEPLFAARAAGDLYRGLVITPADVQAALARIPGAPFDVARESLDAAARATDSLTLHRLSLLERACGLSQFDLDVLILALAPEIDLRYERLYAYLQDDVSLRRPGIDLALNLLCESAGAKLRERSRFAADAPLVRHRLIELYTSPDRLNASLLARAFRIDEQIARFLLLEDGLDSRLAGVAQIVDPSAHADGLIEPRTRQQLESIAAIEPASAIRLMFDGPADCGQTHAAAFLAERLGLRVLAADFSGLSGMPSDDVLRVLPREAWLRGCLLHLRGVEKFSRPEGNDVLAALWPALDATPIPFIAETLTRRGAAQPHARLIRVPFEIPDRARREECWRVALDASPGTNDAGLAASLARTYRLTYRQIEDAAHQARATASAAGDAAAGAGRGEALARAARAQNRHLLSTLAVQIEPRAGWQDLVVPEDVAAQLRELCGQFLERETVLDQWGFRQKLSSGAGVNALFAGPSGTGKTMASEVVAGALGLDLYRIDLTAVVSKYIGETEKNLEAIFSAAENANAILLFDEADALFGKRSEVRDSHDRYANLEISYLLQRMERFDGIAILATNLRQNLDEAFVRRLAFVVNFPLPDETLRRRIWANVWPPSASLDADLDLESLARHLKTTGGDIANIARAAAFLAAAEERPISRAHVLHAASREFEKVGKTLPPGVAEEGRTA